MKGADARVKEHGFGGHVSVYHTKLFAIWTPCNVVNGTLLVQRHPTIEVTSRTEKVKRSLPVVAHVGIVDFSLSDDECLGAEIVPFDLCAIGFEEGLGTRGCGAKSEETIYLDAGGCALFLCDEYGDGGVEARTDGHHSGVFDPELIDDALTPFSRSEHLYFLCNEANRVGLGYGILNVPIFLRFLGECDELLASADGEHAKVFVLAAVFELDRTFPGGEVSATR